MKNLIYQYIFNNSNGNIFNDHNKLSIQNQLLIRTSSKLYEKRRLITVQFYYFLIRLHLSLLNLVLLVL